MIAVVVFGIAIQFFAPKTRPQSATNANVIQIDPCNLIEQVPLPTKVSVFMLLIVFPVLIIQGQRNRPVSRWIAVPTLLALAPIADHELWRVNHCYTGLGKVAFWAFYSASSLMCLHQIISDRRSNRAGIQRNVGKESAQSLAHRNRRAN